jgi:exopolysaccharide biosynthesis protein
MKRLLLILLLASAAHADWTKVARGVDYQRFRRGTLDVHVVRIKVTEPSLRVLATDPKDRGLTVSEFAKKHNAIVAINADYFDEKLQPIGLAMGPCGVWNSAATVRKQSIFGVGKKRATIVSEAEVKKRPKRWMTGAVSGWPVLIRACDAFSPSELPGSDHFTRAPHPRTAVGLTRDGKTMFFVVADGRKEGIPGPTLAELGTFMDDVLGACSALNLDGGGSSAMWVDERIVNVPTDGQERKVGNHLAVVAAKEYAGCE